MHHLRREFLTTTASGLGAMALGSLLTRDGLLGPHTALAAAASPSPMQPRPTHFNAPAKSCIFFFMAGAPSQLDLFDPTLAEFDRLAKARPVTLG